MGRFMVGDWEFDNQCQTEGYAPCPQQFTHSNEQFARTDLIDVIKEKDNDLQSLDFFHDHTLLFLDYSLITLEVGYAGYALYTCPYFALFAAGTKMSIDSIPYGSEVHSV